MHSVDVFALSLGFFFWFFFFGLFVVLLYCLFVCMCSDRATSSTAWRGVRFINYLIIIIINPLTAGVISHFGTAVRRSKMLISSVGSTICLLLIHLLRYLFDFLRVFSLYPWH